MEPLVWDIRLVVLLLALAFALSNGFRNASLIVSTIVTTRALSPTRAFALCAVFEFAGATLLGSAVVGTMGRRLFKSEFLALPSQVGSVLISALVASIAWGIFSWWRGLPTSNSHALFAGL